MKANFGSSYSNQERRNCLVLTLTLEFGIENYKSNEILILDDQLICTKFKPVFYWISNKINYLSSVNGRQHGLERLKMLFRLHAKQTNKRSCLSGTAIQPMYQDLLSSGACS
jgi:hypothetical protein